METYYAKIENGVVVHVEVVTDEFFNSNPDRYSGTWLKVGTEKYPFVSPGYTYIQKEDKLIAPQPFNSWILNEKNEWTAPKSQPKGKCYWDEDKQEWILNTD